MVAQTPAQLGQTLRKARACRGLTLEEVARRTGMSLRFLSELERGKDGASIGRVLRVAAAVGLELALHEGAEDPQIDVDRYPELRLLAWHMPGRRTLGEREALALYEANWRFVDRDRLSPREADLIRQLAQRHGNGALNKYPG